MGYLYALLGALTRAIFPWLVKLYAEEGQISDWRFAFLRSQLVGLFIVFLLAPALMSDLAAVAKMDFQMAWLAGYVVGDVSRIIEQGAVKLYHNVKSS